MMSAWTTGLAVVQAVTAGIFSRMGVDGVRAADRAPEMLASACVDGSCASPLSIKRTQRDLCGLDARIERAIAFGQIALTLGEALGHGEASCDVDGSAFAATDVRSTMSTSSAW